MEPTIGVEDMANIEYSAFREYSKYSFEILFKSNHLSDGYSLHFVRSLSCLVLGWGGGAGVLSST